MGLTDKKSHATLKRALLALARKEDPGYQLDSERLPPRKILSIIASKISISAKHSPYWTGTYLYNLYLYVNKGSKFSIPPLMLDTAVKLAGISTSYDRKQSNSSSNDISPRAKKIASMSHAVSQDNLRSVQRKFLKPVPQLEGREYIPGLKVRDVPSKGLSHRINGRITGRVHGKAPLN